MDLMPPVFSLQVPRSIERDLVEPGPELRAHMRWLLRPIDPDEYFLHRIVRQFRIVQSEMAMIRVLVVPAMASLAELTPAVEAALRPAIGEQVRIEVEAVSDIPLDASGKRRAIVSELSHAG